MPCPSCTNDAVIEIHMRVNGAEITFRRCGRCETQHWSTDDSDLPLSQVLELAAAS